MDISYTLCHVLTHLYWYCRACSPVSRMIALCTCYKKRSKKNIKSGSMTSVEAPVLCSQKQPDQTQTPGRCPESHASTQLNYVYQKGVAYIWIIRLRISPKKTQQPWSFSQTQPLQVGKSCMLQWISFDSGLGRFDTNKHHTVIPHIISPRASLLHSFQCLWAHNPSKDLQKTIRSSRKNKTPCSFQSHFSTQKRSRPEVSSNDPSKPERKLGWNTHKLHGPWCFMKAAPRLRPKELQPYLPTTDLPSQTNRPMPWCATMPLPSLHSCYEFFAFVPGKVGQWIETEIKYAEVLPNCIQWSCDVSQFPKLHTAKRLLKKGATTRSAGSWFQYCICCGSQLDARLWLLVFDSAVNWASLHTTIRWPADLTSSTPGHAHAEKRQG